jgi:hypothetical protein
MKTGFFLGCLTAVCLLSGCGSSSSFDWQGYSRNMTFVQEAGGSHTGNRSTNARTPAIYGFSGWGLRNRIAEVVDPLVSRVEVSDSESAYPGRWQDVMEKIKGQYLAGHPVILVGHSAGCSDAVEVANVLEESNIPVGLLFLDAIHLRTGYFQPNVKDLDHSDLIPGNVYMVVNYVTDSIWRGRNLADSDLKKPERTKVNNVFIRTAHLNLLDDKYSDRYAESIRTIVDEYSSKHSF